MREWVKLINKTVEKKLKIPIALEFKSVSFSQPFSIGAKGLFELTCC